MTLNIFHDFLSNFLAMVTVGGVGFQSFYTSGFFLLVKKNSSFWLRTVGLQWVKISSINAGVKSISDTFWGLCWNTWKSDFRQPESFYQSKFLLWQWLIFHFLLEDDPSSYLWIYLVWVVWIIFCFWFDTFLFSWIFLVSIIILFYFSSNILFLNSPFCIFYFIF